MKMVLAAVLAAAGLVAALSLLHALPFPGPLFLFPIALSLFQFSVTPFLRAAGFYRYHSPMLKSTLRNGRTWEIHGGTSLDYLMFLRFGEPSGTATRRLLVSYLEGLRNIALLVEAGEIARETKVTGTSYFFSERSARRLGFRIERAGLRLRIVLVLYSLDLLVLYSIARGRLAFPNILNARRAVISGGELARNRPIIEALVARLKDPGLHVGRRRNAQAT
jgi:hypothetical protein